MHKKLYLAALTLSILVFSNQHATAQCGLLVDIEPIPRANICLGESVDLLAKNNFTTAIPTVCGLNADRTCGTGSDSVASTIGSGNVVNGYNSSAPELFGDFGDAQSRSQIIILASELQATGFSGGKITSLSIDIARLEAGKNHTIPNISIKMACTPAVNFSNSFFTGLDEVYTPKSVTFTTTGLFIFSFDQAFDWDGQSNIVIEICSYSATGGTAGSVNWGNFTRDHVPGFASWRQVGSPTSNGNCVFTGTEKNFNQRPNIKFNVCRPKSVNLSYLWTPNDGSLSATNVARPTATTNVNTRYYVKITKLDDPTCFNTDSIDITVEDPSLFTPTANTPICAGGTLQFNANTTGVTYFWSGPNGFSSGSPNPIIPNVTVAASGTYTFLIDKGFCKATKTLTVVVQAIPQMGTPKDSTVCRSTTSINLAGLLTNEDPGGTWLDDNASGILTGAVINPSLLNNAILPATFNYTYRITNACGTFNSTVKVSVIATKSAGIDDDTTICETSNAINLFSILDGNPSSGGTWVDLNSSGQMTSGGIFTPTNLGPNTYQFNYTVLGTSPCPNSTAKVTVNVSDQPFAGNDNTASVCLTGTINLFNQLLNSPKPGGIWSDLDNSGGILNTTTGVYTAPAVGPGSYRFRYRVTAVAPCINDTSVITLSVKGPPTISGVNTVCAPSDANYTVTFNISGGDPNTYSVSPSGTITGTNPKTYTSSTIPDATTVTFTVTDANNCGSSSVTTMKRCACPTQSGTVQRSPALQVCNTNLGTVTHQGGYISDGNDTLMYVLHTNSGIILGSILKQQSSPSFSFGAGMVYGQTYYISAVAGNKLPNNLVDLNDQCLSVSQGVPVVFGSITTPAFSFSENPICPGNNLSLTSTFTGNPSFSWVGPNGFISSIANPVINNIQSVNAGSYTVTVSSNGCSASATDVLIVVDKPIITISADAQICAGQSGNLYINITAPAPIFVTYGVLPGTTQQVLLNPGLNTVPISPSVNTTYTLMFANYQGGCGYNLTGSATTTIIPVPSANYSVVGESAFCFNEANTGKIVFQLDPGVTAKLNYSINGATQPQVNGVTNGFQLDVPATQPGITIFEVQSLSLTTGSCVFQNNNPPIAFYNLVDPIVTASLDKLDLCQNDSVKVDFSVVASQKIKIDYMVGTSTRSLITSQDTSIYIKIIGNLVINIQQASYLLKPSCLHVISQSFTINAKPTPTVSVDITTTACNNTNTGIIAATSQSSSDLFSLDGSAFGPDGTFENLFSGFHVLIVKATNGCEVKQNIEIVSTSNLTIAATVLSTACGFQNGSVDLSVVNGKAPYTILFNGNSVNQGLISNLSPGTYPVLVIDANNCVKQQNIIIAPSSPISLNITDNGLVDCAAPEYSAVFVSATGGTGNYSYSVPSQPAQTDSVFLGLYPQTYVITVSDDRGCVTSKQHKLSAIQKFNIVPTIRKQLLCFEGQDAEIIVNTANASLPALYSLDNIIYQTNNLFTGIGPGVFTVYVRETSGCYREQVISFAVTRPDPINLTLVSSGPPSCFNTPDGFIALSASGGSLQNKQYSVNGTDYFTSPNFTGLLKGAYTLVARNGDDCHSDTIPFILNGPDDILITNSFTFNAGQSLAELTIQASGGSPNYLYSINGTDFISTNVFTDLPPTTYTSYVRDSRNCTAAQQVAISGVGISETDLGSLLSFFPNPFRDEFSISASRPITDISLRIVNLIGEEVYYGKFGELSTNPISIRPDVSLAPGVYGLIINSREGSSIKRLIKQ